MVMSLTKYIISLYMVLVFGCDRNIIPGSVIAPQSAVIPVAVDWSLSGLVVSRGVDVHRLSLRFYPEGGGDVFERYLEEDIYNGEVEVPQGRYQVIALNESIADKSYWSGVLRFTDADDYTLFAAELVSEDDEAVEPYALAAWSLGMFEVTDNMAILTRGVASGDVELTEYEHAQMEALTKVVMLPRTRTMNVSVETENLGSVQGVTASVHGLSRSVNIVTGESEVDPLRHTFTLDTYTYNESSSRAVSADTDGVVSGERECLGHSDDYDGAYTMDLEVYLADGSLHDGDGVSGVDVGDDILSTESQSDYFITHQLSVPEVTGGDISVDGWVEGDDIELN